MSARTEHSIVNEDTKVRRKCQVSVLEKDRRATKVLTTRLITRALSTTLINKAKRDTQRNGTSLIPLMAWLYSNREAMKEIISCLNR